MKYLIKYLVIAVFTLSQIACHKDNTTQDTRELSEISVVFNEVKDQVINMDRLEVLTIDPIITQTEPGKELSYQWEVNYQVFSTEKKLVYPCNKLGTYFVRLKVTNSDGSTFKSFKLNVNSAYEQGLIVLGEDAAGEGTLAFMRKYSDAEIAGGKVESFINNVFLLNNPGFKLGKGVTDVSKRVQQVFISNKEEKKIYIINNKTFELEGTIDAPDIPDFKPIKMHLPDGAFLTMVIVCENGKLYKLSPGESLVVTDTKYPLNVIEQTAFGYSVSDHFSYFWNPVLSIMYLNRANSVVNSGNEFAGKNMIKFFYADNSVATETSFYAIYNTLANPSVYYKTVYNDRLAVIKERNVALTGGISSTLKSNSIIEVNATYKKLVYTDGNRIYNWFYTSSSSPTTPFITVDGGVITSMSQTTDGKVLYVGVYNASAPGLKGSVYVYDMDSGALIKKHEGVTDKPVKLFYKKSS